MELEAAGEASFGPCSCCGHDTRRVWGYLHEDDRTVAAYFVEWTVGRVTEEGAHFDFVLGEWGNGTSRVDRVAVSLAFRWTEAGPEFMVVDASTRPIGSSELSGRGMSRDEVVETPLAAQAFGLVDEVWLSDPRLGEIKSGGGRTSG